MKRDLKVMGPDFPVPPKQDLIPFTLQRLYNNYMTSYYTTGSGAADVIYHCIKAYQIAGECLFLGFQLQNEFTKLYTLLGKFFLCKIILSKKNWQQI